MTKSNLLKGVSNRLKSKGLQKLRWYCQLCEKQCRDENGFKCHCLSESHIRRVHNFGTNQQSTVAEFSRAFELNFLKHLQCSYRHTRVEATRVYNEVISHKEHIHMNATKWTTLTEFLKHLASKEGCEIEETPKGWFILYRPTDSEEALRMRLNNKRERENVNERSIEKVIISQSKSCKSSAPNIPSPSKMQMGKTVQTFTLKPKPECISHAQEALDCQWICVGLVVRVKAKQSLGKGVVSAINRLHLVTVSFAIGIFQEFSQAELEPVVPKIGASVFIISGSLKGAKAELLGIDLKRKEARIQMVDDGHRADKIVGLSEICKFEESRLVGLTSTEQTHALA